MKKLIPILISCLFLSACSEYQKVLKSSDYEKKYQAAVRYFDEKDYFKSLTLLEELISVYKGTKNAEKIYYYYSYCNYYQGDYELAAYHFDNFVKTFPNSEWTEECSFMNAYCYYANAPVYSLDQSSNYKAIAQLQLFIDRYPGSAKVSKCNELIDQLREKLERKDYENSKLLYDMGDYKSAIFAFGNFLKDYPNTPHREGALFSILKASYLYAGSSIEKKRAERYKAALEAYYAFTSAFPQSRHRREAQLIFEDSLKLIEKFKQVNS